MKTEARHACAASARHQKKHEIAAVQGFGYTRRVTSKKGVIGIGVPPNHCDESRSFCPAENAASLSVPQFMVARTGERKLRQFTQVVAGTPTRSSYRPQLALGAVVVAKPTTWRPHMAQLTLGTSAASTPTLSAVNGTVTALSTDVASHFGKRHDHVLRDIDTLLQDLPAEHLPNFEEVFVEYQNGNGAIQKARAYRLTRDGFTLLAMGFTGKKALAFKLAYLDAFNRMEAELAGRAHQPPANTLHSGDDVLSKLSQASNLGHLVQQQVLAQLLTTGQPMPGSHLPASVRPLVHHKAATIAAQALPHIQAWLVNQIAWGDDLSSPTGQSNLERNAATRLAHCTFDGWLSDGKANAARSLINLFATLKAMATENEAATLAQLSQLLASPQQPAIGQAGSAQAQIGGGV